MKDKLILGLCKSEHRSRLKVEYYVDNDNVPSLTLLHSHNFRKRYSDIGYRQVWHLIQVDYQTKKLHIVTIISKYRKFISNNKLLCML